MPRARIDQDLSAFGVLLEPAEALEPILARDLRDVFLSWLTEIWAERELAEVDVKPRRRAIFDGPPGTGKTTLAHHLAARLGMAMIVVRPETIVAAYVGESAQNMGALFDAIDDYQTDNAPLVVFFDEFDSLGARREYGGGRSAGANRQHTEMVNTLLARIEAFDGIVIAATNHADSLDPALWRRFEMHVHLPLPAAPERARILALYLKPFQLPKRQLSLLAEQCDSASPALMRQFCEGLKRNIIVGPKAGWSMGKRDVVERVLASIKPHPDLGLPSLWSLGTKAKAIDALDWPLSRDAPVKDHGADIHAPDTVVAFPGGAQ